MIKSYRKKPVVIEAALINEVTQFEVIEWSCSSVRPTLSMPTEQNPDGVCWQIDTLEGSMTAIPGDFIIKGVKGEFYPCKPDIFHMTYEDA